MVPFFVVTDYFICIIEFESEQRVHYFGRRSRLVVAEVSYILIDENGVWWCSVWVLKNPKLEYLRAGKYLMDLCLVDLY